VQRYFEKFHHKNKTVYSGIISFVSIVQKSSLPIAEGWVSPNALLNVVVVLTLDILSLYQVFKAPMAVGTLAKSIPTHKNSAHSQLNSI
jgi:hypothetical protein